MDKKSALSRSELIRMMNALGCLSAGILSMDKVARDLMGKSGAGAVDCVG